MRVIAGHLRGRRLQAPAGRTTRPITDRAKETLFDMLTHRLAGTGGWEAVCVLDLFAGSGSLGIEALSRGARHCTFVEHDRPALQALRGNLRALGLEARSAVLASNAWAGPIRTADQGSDLPAPDQGSVRPAPARGSDLPAPDQGSVRPAPARGFGLPTPDQGLGLAFLDPPYRDSRDVQRVADLLNRVAKVLAAGGLAVLRLETKAIRPPPDALPDLKPAGDRAVGSTRLVYLEKTE